MLWALAFALPSAGNSSEARMAMIAMTTSNSMRVNAEKRNGMLFTEGNEDNEGDAGLGPRTANRLGRDDAKGTATVNPEP